MAANVDMEKIAVVGADSTLGKLRHLASKLVHRLQTEPRDVNVGGQAQRVLAVRNAANFEIVFRAAVAGMHGNGNASSVPKILECIDESPIDLKTATAAACKFFARKVRAQVTHSTIP
jgi:hypothetical protein